MSNYGLVVTNNNGGVMFDSTKAMNSYVIKEIGTGTGISDTSNIENEFIFVRPPAGQEATLSSQIIYASPRLNNISCGFFQFNDATNVSSSVILDYFVVAHSEQIELTGNYGLQIKNEGGSVQFDSRSIKLGNHFLVTKYHAPKTITGNPDDLPAGFNVGDVNDYWEIGKWTVALPSGNVMGFLQGIQFDSSEIKIWGFYENPFAGDENNSGGGQDEGGGTGSPYGGGTTPGFNTPVGRQYDRPINQMIISAELV